MLQHYYTQCTTSHCRRRFWNATLRLRSAISLHLYSTKQRFLLECHRFFTTSTHFWNCAPYKCLYTIIIVLLLLQLKVSWCLTEDKTSVLTALKSDRNSEPKMQFCRATTRYLLMRLSHANSINCRCEITPCHNVTLCSNCNIQTNTAESVRTIITIILVQCVPINCPFRFHI